MCRYKNVGRKKGAATNRADTGMKLSLDGCTELPQVKEMERKDDLASGNAGTHAEMAT